MCVRAYILEYTSRQDACIYAIREISGRNQYIESLKKRLLVTQIPWPRDRKKISLA